MGGGYLHEDGGGGSHVWMLLWEQAWSSSPNVLTLVCSSTGVAEPESIDSIMSHWVCTLALLTMLKQCGPGLETEACTTLGLKLHSGRTTGTGTCRTSGHLTSGGAWRGNCKAKYSQAGVVQLAHLCYPPVQ